MGLGQVKRLWLALPILLFACAKSTPEEHQTTEKRVQTEFVLPKPGTATFATQQANAALATRMNMDDSIDMVRAGSGMIGQIPGGTIYDAKGNVVWDQSRFSFLDGDAPETVNPSLWRQAKLNTMHGLFKVGDGIYQLRGYDLSVMTIIEGKTGWIVVDPLLSRETAAAALGLARQHLGQHPISAMIYSHSHADHFGGAHGIVDGEPNATNIPIYAPMGFDTAAISENVLAGNAMTRRASYMFGANLPRSATGVVDSGIGKTISLGTIGFIPPTIHITAQNMSMMIDGVRFEFMNTPDTEAPSEMVFYLPDHKTLFVAELATATLHNVLTLRGAQVRNAKAWADDLDMMLQKWGDQAELAISAHNWPRFGNEDVRQYLADNRDIYRYLNNESLRLANQGATISEVGNLIAEPFVQRNDFAVRNYYGTLNHNSKAVVQRYFGWFDGVPAHLNPHPPEAEAKRMVKLAGSEDALLLAAQQAFSEGDYRWAATLTNHLVFANPDNRQGKQLLAAAYEQMGFQAESAPWRNIYLAGARELRHGIARGGPSTMSADFVNALPTESWFDAFTARMNPKKAQDLNLILHYHLTDTKEHRTVEVRDGVASHRQGIPANADLSITMKRSDLNEITLGKSGFARKLASGAIQVDGNVLIFLNYLKTHDQYDPHFAIVTP